MKIGARVIVYNQVMRLRRKELNLTQKDLADLVSINVGVIGEIELLKAPNVNIRTLRGKLGEIAEVLGISFSNLFPQDYLDAVKNKLLPKKSSFEWEVK